MVRLCLINANDKSYLPNILETEEYHNLDVELSRGIWREHRDSADLKTKEEDKFKALSSKFPEIEFVIYCCHTKNTKLDVYYLKEQILRKTKQHSLVNLDTPNGIIPARYDLEDVDCLEGEVSELSLDD